MAYEQKCGFLLLAIWSAAGMNADQIKVYNDSYRQLAVAIVQGGKDETGDFLIVDAGKVKGLKANQTRIYSIYTPALYALVERPSRALGKDTFLVVGSDSERLKEVLESGKIDPKDAYKIGQIGNREVFLGTIFGGELIAYAHYFDTAQVAMYKSYKDMVAASGIPRLRSQWTEDKSFVTVTLPEGLPSWSQKARRALQR
jgi:hypothetical protein